MRQDESYSSKEFVGTQIKEEKDGQGIDQTRQEGHETNQGHPWTDQGQAGTDQGQPGTDHGQPGTVQG